MSFINGFLHLFSIRATIPSLIDSVRKVNFTSQGGWNVNFDAYGNAPPRYDLRNLLKTEGDHGKPVYSYQKVHVIVICKVLSR